MVLQDYQDFVGTTAMVCTIGHMFTGTLICKDFYKDGTTKDFSPVPFLGGLTMCLLMLRYALFLNDSTMVTVNICGFLLHIIYMLVFMKYSHEKAKAIRLLGKFAFLTVVCLAYAEYENKENVEYRFGMIVTCISILLIASPFLFLAEIIKTKDASILPLPLVLSSSIVFLTWLLYGLAINNVFLIFQNLISLGMSVTQLSLIVMYPSKPKLIKKLE